VQFNFAEFVTRAQEPKSPKKRLAPSTPPDGVTVRRETWSCSITTGERNAKTESRIAVSARRGARYNVTAFERPAIMVAMRQEK